MCLDGKRQGNWIQCQSCGEIYRIPYTIEVSKLYVETQCPVCKSDMGLNIGTKKDDLYYFYNTNLDNRYYTYSTK